jgi:hypothetical protein
LIGFGGGLVDGGIFLFEELFGVVGGVVTEVAVEEVLVGAEEEGARAAGGIEDFEFGGVFGGEG